MPPAAPGARLRHWSPAAAEVDAAVADRALPQLEVDDLGLDSLDRRYLGCIAVNYGGGPVGVDTMAAALSEQRDTLEEMVEPLSAAAGPAAAHAARAPADAPRLAASRLEPPPAARTARPDCSTTDPVTTRRR